MLHALGYVLKIRNIHLNILTLFHDSQQPSPVSQALLLLQHPLLVLCALGDVLKIRNIHLKTLALNRYLTSFQDSEWAPPASRPSLHSHLFSEPMQKVVALLGVMVTVEFVAMGPQLGQKPLLRSLLDQHLSRDDVLPFFSKENVGL